jgi:hypothetical protein
LSANLTPLADELIRDGSSSPSALRCVSTTVDARRHIPSAMRSMPSRSSIIANGEISTMWTGSEVTLRRILKDNSHGSQGILENSSWRKSPGPFNSEVQRVGLLSYARIFFI